MADRLQALRILDANANRAAEGLRTIEDFARLHWEDEAAAEQVKLLRHELTRILNNIDRAGRLQVRSTARDAGTQLSTTEETRRIDCGAIVTAASERTTQALRVLEECAKLLSPGVSAALKQLRYRTYDELASVELRLQRQPGMGAMQLYLLIDCAQTIDTFCEYIAGLAEAGVDLFQIRDKGADGDKLLRYTRAAVSMLRSTESRVIVNDRVDIALAGVAAGVHLGQTDIAFEDAKRLIRSDMWIGVSTHSMQQALAAQQAGADYIGCGPTFRSSTKHFDDLPGTDFLREAINQISIPTFAIGGINADNISQVVAAGCNRVAVSGAIHLASDPDLAARQLKQQLRGQVV